MINDKWSDVEIQQALEAAKRRGLAVSMLPHPNEDRYALGIDRDRSKWSADARERYDGLEARLPPPAALKRLESTSHRAAVAIVTRVIDDRPCDPLEPGDSDWWSAEDDVGCS